LGHDVYIFVSAHLHMHAHTCAYTHYFNLRFLGRTRVSSVTQSRSS